MGDELEGLRSAWPGALSALNAPFPGSHLGDKGECVRATLSLLHDRSFSYTGTARRRSGLYHHGRQRAPTSRS